jgi:cation diffusion facilitator family transporter
MHTTDIAAYEHAHRFHATSAGTQARTLRVVVLTVVMMAVEIVAGWIFHSMALLADGWHMSTHAVALGISWAAFALARRHAADRRFVFGTWKVEILGGYTSAILLGVTGLAMAGISVERLFHPVAIQFNQAILVAVIGLAVNLVSIFLLDEPAHVHGHPHDHVHGSDPHEHGHDHPHPHAHDGHDAHDDAEHDPAAPAGHNLNLRAAYLHVVADALTSVLAIAALLGGKYLHWNWLDPIMGIVGAVLIVRWTVQLLSQTGGILLDRELDDTTSRAVRAAIESDADSRVSDLHVWRVGQGRYACIVTVVASRPQTLAVYRERLRGVEGVVHATVEIAPCTPAAERPTVPTA